MRLLLNIFNRFYIISRLDSNALVPMQSGLPKPIQNKSTICFSQVTVQRGQGDEREIGDGAADGVELVAGAAAHHHRQARPLTHQAQQIHQRVHLELEAVDGDVEVTRLTGNGM